MNGSTYRVRSAPSVPGLAVEGWAADWAADSPAGRTDRTCAAAAPGTAATRLAVANGARTHAAAMRPRNLTGLSSSPRPCGTARAQPPSRLVTFTPAGPDLLRPAARKIM